MRGFSSFTLRAALSNPSDRLMLDDRLGFSSFTCELQSPILQIGFHLMIDFSSFSLQAAVSIVQTTPKLSGKSNLTQQVVFIVFLRCSLYTLAYHVTCLPLML